MTNTAVINLEKTEFPSNNQFKVLNITAEMRLIIFERTKLSRQFTSPCNVTELQKKVENCHNF